jgi:toxin ParE1/3/4
VRVELSSQALDDLRSIRDWIARDNPDRARSFVQELRQACAELAGRPLLYPALAERPAVHRRKYKRYLIFYTVEDDRIVVVAVTHAARDYLKLLGED